MSRRGVREHSTKRNGSIIHRPCTTQHNTPTSTARAGALMFHHPAWVEHRCCFFVVVVCFFFVVVFLLLLFAFFCCLLFLLFAFFCCLFFCFAFFFFAFFCCVCFFFFCCCVREHSTKRTDGIIHRSCMRTTTHRPAQHELALCDRCHTALASGAHGWVPAGHPRYTRADFGQEAVGGSTTTTRARKRHATRDTQCEQQVCRPPPT